jgi:zinc D-Ala-D-Ala carboxypeptidase
MRPVTKAIPYFSERELACKGSGIIKLDPRFAEALPKLREAWGKALVATSVCRSPEHNLKVKGHPSSLHLTENPIWPTMGTMAADIAWRGWPIENQILFARMAWKMGWSVGLHDGFCHIDRRADMKLDRLKQAVFIYGQWSGVFGRVEISG